VNLPLQFRQLNVIYLAAPRLGTGTNEVLALVADLSRLTGRRPAGLSEHAVTGAARRSTAARVVTVGSWRLRARFFGIGATYDFTFYSNGTLKGRAKAGFAGAVLSGRWNFDAATQVLYLEASGGIQEGMRSFHIEITRWHSDDDADCTFEGRKGTLQRIYPEGMRG
jgi:hypothetical protein